MARCGSSDRSTLHAFRCYFILLLIAWTSICDNGKPKVRLILVFNDSEHLNRCNGSKAENNFSQSTYHLLYTVSISGGSNVSGGKATSGSNETTQDVLQLISTQFLMRYAVRRVEAFNDRIYLSRYRRNYWLGRRYYWMDTANYLATRDTCLYDMDSDGRRIFEYIDGSPIYEIIYQCQRYVQYCCGLVCCMDKFSENLHKKFSNRKILDARNSSKTFQFKLYFFLSFVFAFSIYI